MILGARAGGAVVRAAGRQRGRVERVDVALAAGATDNGAPGPRPHYHQNYYGGFVLDPDGNNVEAVYHGAMQPG